MTSTINFNDGYDAYINSLPLDGGQQQMGKTTTSINSPANQQLRRRKQMAQARRLQSAFISSQDNKGNKSKPNSLVSPTSSTPS
jgi:hypothetical protein